MARLEVYFEIPMAPKAQSRGRVGTLPMGKNPDGTTRYRGSIFEDPEAKAHKQTLRALAAPFRPLGDDGKPVLFCGALEVRIVAVMPRPMSLQSVSKRDNRPLKNPGRRWHTSKPDKDNLEKAVLDALKDWWQDDSQVCVGPVFKQIAAFNESPHYEIFIAQLAPIDDDRAAPKIDLCSISEHWFAEFPF